MLSALFTGIQSKFSGDSDLSSALTGGLYLVEAPADYDTYPYGTYFIVSAVPQETFSSTIEQVMIQFNIFHNSATDTTVNDVYDKLTALYDNCTLTVSGYNFISMLRQNTYHLREDDIWQVSVEYMIRMVL
ncbi:MAG: hypothetical protein ABIG63_04610 [Chloroflexota bacterium]